MTIQSPKRWLPWCLLVWGATAGAQAPVDSGFIGTVRAIAYAYPGTLAAARSQDAAAEDQKVARWQRFPSPSLQSVSPQGGTALDRVNRLALEQPLYAGGRIDAGIDAADQRYASGSHYYRQVAQETAIKLVNTWYEWLRQRDRLAVQQEGVKAHRKLRDQIERRVQQGISTEIDLALVAARLSQVQSELAQTQSALAGAWALLEQLAGEQLHSLQASGEALQPADLPVPQANWTALSVTHSPLLAKLDADRSAADADIKVKQGQLLPSVSLVVDRNFSGPRQENRTWLQVSMQPGAGLSSMAAIRGAAARRDAAAESLRNAALELQQSIIADLAAHASASEQMQVADLLRRSTEDVAQSYARQFVAGRKSWLEVLNAVREAMLARLSVIDANALRGQTAWRLRLRAFGLEALPGGAS